MSNIIINKATPADSRDIWLWRNDETTREMSVSTDEVPWSSHNRWFEESLSNANRYLYIGLLENDQGKVGMCRFDVDVDRNVAEVSINLNPKKRGQGLSGRLLSESMRQFLSERDINLVATIKKKNKASIKCFIRCGFVFSHEDGLCNYYVFPKGPPLSE